MKEVTRTIIKRYDAEGKLIEHTETTVEKQLHYNVLDDYRDKCYPKPPWKPSCGTGNANWLYNPELITYL